MQTLKPIDPDTASAKAKQLLEAFQQRNGRSSNMLRVMAQSPAILEAYLQFNRAFEQARISAKERGLITAAVAQLVGSEYVLSIAAALGAREGLSEEEFEAARKGESKDPKIAQALRFARLVVERHGQVNPAEVASLQRAGYSDAEVVEIIAAIALNLFRNYFNLIVRTEVDFPVVRLTEPVRMPVAG
jgi:alkylhydroperoxidase family enzyme